MICGSFRIKCINESVFVDYTLAFYSRVYVIVIDLLLTTFCGKFWNNCPFECQRSMSKVSIILFVVVPKKTGAEILTATAFDLEAANI